MDQLAQIEHLDWSPILRGIRVASPPENDRARSERVISSAGMIETSYQAREGINTNITPSPKGFPTWWILRTFAHTIITAEAFRVRYGRPELEYALDFEWRLPWGAKMLLPENRDWHNRSVSPVEPINRVANYEMPPRAGLPRLFEMLHTDVGSSCGMRLPYVYQIDFDAAVESILGN
ncbi:hypothetical protein [Aurantimonas sp.]|uniref:hypothetical protein n=1 Tax=Aurantimonas sp. TaxID=1872654 RepID=UPI003513888D